MKKTIQKILSVMLIIGLCIGMLGTDTMFVYAGETASQEEWTIQLAPDARMMRFGTGESGEITVLNAEPGESQTERDLFANRPDICSSEEVSAPAVELTGATVSLDTYFKAEYLEALNMRGSNAKSNGYYDIYLYPYRISYSSSTYSNLLDDVYSDLYSDWYDIDTFGNYLYPNRFHMAGDTRSYTDSSGYVQYLRIYYSAYADYFSSYYSAIEQLDSDIWGNLGSYSMNVEEYMLYIHDAMIRELNFDYLDWKNGVADDVQLHTHWGTMAWRIGLCDAYAYIYKYYMDIMTYGSGYTHIFNRVVLSESLNHMWNMVKLNGSWYHVDTAWDDLVMTNHTFSTTFGTVNPQTGMYGDYNPDYDDEGYVGHAYFLKTDSEMRAYGYSGWTKYLPRRGSGTVAPASATSPLNHFYTNVDGAVTYAGGYWYKTTSDGNSKYIIRGKIDGTDTSTIVTNDRVRYLQAYGTYLYYTDGKKIIRSDLNGENTVVAKVTSGTQILSEFAIKNGMFSYKVISGTTSTDIKQSAGGVSWVAGCTHSWQNVLTTPATAQADGAYEIKCSLCGEVDGSGVISKIADLSLDANTFTYDGTEKKPAVSVKDVTGAVIDSSNYSVSYANQTAPGTATVTVTFSNWYSGTLSANYTIVCGHNWVTQLQTPATTTADGEIVTICSICQAKQGSSAIPKIAKVALSKTSVVYNGKMQTPEVIVLDANGNSIAPSNYSVAYTNNKKIGIGKAVITFLGNYSGSETLEFDICPKATSISKVTAGTKSFSIAWKKAKKGISGYQIQYSTTKKFTKNKTVTTNVNSTKLVKGKASNLKSKQKYYIRIRTFSTVKTGGKKTTLYSAWSKTKSITTN